MPAVIQFFAAVAILILACVSLFGWGLLVRRLGRLCGGTWPTTMALGLSALLFVGGIANLTRVAFATTTWILAGSGLLLAAFESVRNRSSKTIVHFTPARFEGALVVTFIAVVTGFVIATQLPPGVFNFHDDLQKYFAHPVRQLQTGTLYGSPLSALGSQTLGGMAFLHSFVLSIAPIEFINGVDTLLGLFLLMAIGASAGWRRMMPLPGAIFAPVLIVAINPQYVNVSALYLGATLISAAIMLTCDDRENQPPSPLSSGLVYGGLLALKPTFAAFVALHLPLTAVAMALGTRRAGYGAQWAFRCTAFTALALSPWIILHLPHYLDFAGSASKFERQFVPEGSQEHFALLSTDRLFYGATMANYTILAALAVLAALWTLISLLKNGDRDSDALYLARSSNLIASAATGVLSYGIILLLSPLLHGYKESLRYSIPLLLGIVPLVTVLSACNIFHRSNLLIMSGVPAIACLGAAITFWPSLIERYWQATEYRSMFDFNWTPQHIDYIRTALSPASAQKIRDLQLLIPTGEPLVAWINQPYHFDFKRNPVFDAEIAGLATPWARLPSSARYIIWEYKGFGVRSPQEYAYFAQVGNRLDRAHAMSALSFAQKIESELQKSTILFADDRFVVARLP